MTNLDIFQGNIMRSRSDVAGMDTMALSALKLTEEAGEVAGVIYRLCMNDGKKSKLHHDLVAEVGDVLVACARVAEFGGFDLAQAAQYAQDKQAKRRKTRDKDKKRGKV